MTGDATIGELWTQLIDTWRWDSPLSVFIAIVLGSFAAGHVVKVITPLRARAWLFAIFYKTVPGFAATVGVLLLLCLATLQALPEVLPESWLAPLTAGEAGVRHLLIWGLTITAGGFIASFVFGSIVALNHYDLMRIEARRSKR